MTILPLQTLQLFMLNMITIFSILFLFLGVLMMIPILILIFIAPLNKFKYNKFRNYKKFEPYISLIIPAYNEGNVIERTILKFLSTDYPSNKKELLIINDGSTDNTAVSIEKYAGLIINSETQNTIYNKCGEKNIILINRKNGGNGKAFALNIGKKYAKASEKEQLLAFIDADVQLNQDTFNRTVSHFKDDKVWAVAGNIEVSEKKGKILNKFVDFECVVAQKLVRKGFDTLGVHYIIPGGYGAFKREAFEAIGGKYPTDTLAEDTDLTWKLATETKKNIVFDEKIVVTADEPTDLLAIWNQRVRWARGNFAVSMKHRHKIGKSKYGKAATIGIPFWFANMFVPIAFIFTTLGFLLTLIFPINIGIYALFGLYFTFPIFIGIWLLGVIVNNGKSWYAGLIAPGIPMLIVLFASMHINGGFTQFISFIHLANYNIIAIGLFIWISLSIPFTYFVIHSKIINKKFAEFIVIIFCGYWSILVGSALNGYVKELKKENLVWVRTVR